MSQLLMQDHDACLLDFEQQPAMHERSHARHAMHMSCHQAFRLPMPRRRRARFRWLPMHFYGCGGRNHSWRFSVMPHVQYIAKLSLNCPSSPRSVTSIWSPSSVVNFCHRQSPVSFSVCSFRSQISALTFAYTYITSAPSRSRSVSFVATCSVR